MKNTLKRLAIVVICSTAFISTALALEATSGFSASPTLPNKIDPSQFSYEVKPGSTIQDTITVTNHDSKPANLSMYATDSTKDKDNKVSFKIEIDPQTEIGKWTTVSQKTIELGPKSSQDIPFTITIPQDAALKDYLGGISSEVRSVNTANGSHVNVNYRIVTKINLKVTDTPKPIEKLPPKPLITVSPTQIYLYISAALLVLVLGWFGVKSVKARKHRKASAKHHEDK